MRFIKFFCVLLLVVAVFGFSIISYAEAGKWRAGTVANKGTLDFDTFQKWCDLVGNNTNGKISIDPFPSEQLGPYRDMFDNTVRGTQQAGLLPISPEFDQRLQAVYTVYLAESWEEGRQIFQKDGWMFQLLAPVFADLGLKPLGFYFLGLDGLGSTKGPVVLPEDLKKENVKVRTWCAADRLFFEEIGAQTVDISFSELFTSLQTGVAHAQDNAPLVTYDHLREVTKYYTDTNHIFETLVLVLNKDLWDNQTPEIQKAIQDAADEALSWGNAQAEETSEAYLKKMEESGIHVTRLTREQRAQWKDFGLSSWKKFVDIIGKKDMDIIAKNVGR